ncbi:hypothetical protein LUX57_45945 [Actinomadura madurae]|uniref:hypothetical protein n=1 Tax=Actinomadura madurae TaxID=1993 RepID=UPI0020D24DA8|nr:hypothetical protein [Actinomadura madurae]MCP9971553.1 hypothetical protein [Actinomadura madurae]
MNTGAMDDEHAIVRVEVRYRLRGFDRGEVARTRYLALAPRGGTWTIAGDGTSRGLTDDADIWDAGPLAVARGRAALVIGDAAGLRGIAARLDAAVPDVTGVVGAGWARRVVALAPADPGLASALAGPGQSLGQIAALATVAPAPSSGGRGEDRIVVSPHRLRQAQRPRPHGRPDARADPRRHRRRPRPQDAALAHRGLRGLRRLPARRDRRPRGGRRAAPRGRGRAGARRPARDRRLRRRLPAPLPGLPGGLARLPDGRRPVR